MKIVLALLGSLVCGVCAYAQTGKLPQDVNISRPVIVLPETARYQIIPIIQFGLHVKLDRYSGKTYQYDPGRARWYLLNVRGGLPTAGSNLTPRYQIYDVDNFIFLINNETGQTWILVTRTWEPIAD